MEVVAILMDACKVQCSINPDHPEPNAMRRGRASQTVLLFAQSSNNCTLTDLLSSSERSQLYECH